MTDYTKSGRCLGFLLMALATTLHAQDSLRDRFLSEGPSAWDRLKSGTLQLEGKAVEHARKEGNTRFVQEIRFKINGDFLVFEEVRKAPEGQVKKARAMGVNSKYIFFLRQNPPAHDWLLDGIETPMEDRLDLRHPYAYAVGFGFMKFLEAPFTIAGLPLSRIVPEVGFVVEKAEGVAGDLVKVSFTS